MKSSVLVSPARRLFAQTLLAVLAACYLFAVSAPQAQASSLTEAQIQAIVGLISSFGADPATVDDVNWILRNPTPAPSGELGLVLGAAVERGTVAADEKELRALSDSINTKKTKKSSAAAADKQLTDAKKRATLLEGLAKKDAKAFLRNVTPPSSRAQLPAAVQAVTEQKVTLTGAVEVLHVDDFNNEDNSHFEYTLRAGSSRLAFYPVGEAPALESGTVLQVSGYQIGKTVVAATGPATLKVTSQSKKKKVEAQRLLVVLVTPPSSAGLPNADRMKKTIFSGAFEKFYEEQSYGAVRFAGDVTDWIPLTGFYPTQACDPGNINFERQEIKDYLLKKKIKLANYERVAFVLNTVYGGCAFVGKIPQTFNGATYTLSSAWVGWPDSPWDKQNMTGFEYVLAHEVGHELGVIHANSWSCQGPSLDKDCRHNEYGNHYDAMGTGSNSLHFNAFYKDFLGWLATSSKVSVTQSGTYSLSPLESQTGVRAAVVQNPATPSVAPLYVEFRQPLGFDSTLSPSSAGLFLNQVIDKAQWIPISRLLNANYATDSNKAHAFMPGGTFAWSSHGIEVGSLTTTKSLATFTVMLEKPACEAAGIAISQVQSSENVSAGAFGFLGFNLTNNDSVACTPSAIAISTVISDSVGWMTSRYPSEPFTLASGESQYVWINFSSMADSKIGNHDITVTISDNNGRSYTLARTFAVVQPATIESITPQSGPVGTTVTLRGTNFATSPVNTVSIQGTAIGSYLSNIAATSSTTLSFIIPTTMETWSGEKGISGTAVPTPLGSYWVAVFNAASGSYTNSVQFEVVAAGTSTQTSLGISTDASSPSYQVVAGGTDGVTLGVFKFRATGEAINLTKVGFTLASGKSTDLTQVYLYNNSGTLLGTATFVGTNTGAVSTLSTQLNIPRDTDVNVIVKADIAGIGVSQAGTSGGLIKIQLDDPTQGTGVTSGLTIRATASAPVQSTGVRLFKTFPTVSLVSLPTEGLADGRLLRFTITANTAGPVGIGQVALTVAGLAAGTNGQADLYAYTDSAYSSPISGFTNGAINGLPVSSATPGGSLWFPSPVEIPAGATYYFELRDSTKGTGLTNSNTLATTLLGQGTYAGVTSLTSLKDKDVMLVWSPNSTATAQFSHPDWTNGYGVPGLPVNGLGQSRYKSLKGAPAAVTGVSSNTITDATTQTAVPATATPATATPAASGPGTNTTQSSVNKTSTDRTQTSAEETAADKTRNSTTEPSTSDRNKTSTKSEPVATPVAVTASATNATDHRGQNGQSFTYQCSAAAAQGGAVWGSNPYTDDSSVCTAARHAGAIEKSGGSVTITISKGKSSYKGSTKNGVTSQKWGAFDGSFSIQSATADEDKSASSNYGAMAASVAMAPVNLLVDIFTDFFLAMGVGQ